MVAKKNNKKNLQSSLGVETTERSGSFVHEFFLSFTCAAAADSLRSCFIAGAANRMRRLSDMSLDSMQRSSLKFSSVWTTLESNWYILFEQLW